jgi:hypothetical protein
MCVWIFSTILPEMCVWIFSTILPEMCVWIFSTILPEMCVWIFSTILPEIFPVLRRTERDVIINVPRSSCKVHVFRARCK